MHYQHCSKLSPFWQRDHNQKSRDLLRNRIKVKQIRMRGKRMVEQILQSAADSPVSRVACPPSSTSSASHECALQTGPSMPLSTSTQLCDLLLSRGEVLDLISIAYFTEIMRKSMPHSITKCSSAVASLVNLIFRIINQAHRHIDWEIFPFHQRKKGKTETTQHWLLSQKPEL